MPPLAPIGTTLIIDNIPCIIIGIPLDAQTNPIYILEDIYQLRIALTAAQLAPLLPTP